MTNAEAIETLRANYPDACFEQLRCAVDMAIKALEKPEHKKGKWIYLDKDKRFFHPHIVKCSVCDNTLDMYGVNAGRGDANFCPNCGADMREPEDIPIEYFESGGR